MIRVELIGKEVIDVTGHVSRVEWRNSTQPPWHTITVDVTGYMLAPPATVGTHVVIRLAAAPRGPVAEQGVFGPPALAWGIVTGLATSRSMSGPDLSEGVWTITALGWFDYLGKVDVICTQNVTAFGLSADGREIRNTAGTLFGQVDPWTQFAQQMRQITGTAGSTDPSVPRDLPTGAEDLFQIITNGPLYAAGPSLTAFVKLMARIQLPEGLGSGTIGSGVSGIYDAATAAQFSGEGALERRGYPGRGAEPVIGGRNTPQSLYTGSNKGTALIFGTWGADPGIVEMFPSLEYAGRYSAPRDATVQTLERLEDSARRATGASAPSTVSPFTPRPIEEGEAFFDPSFVTTIVARNLASTLGRSLGKNPCLIYRVRPWRTTPLSRYVDTVVRRSSPGFPADEVIESIQSEFGSFELPSWDVARAPVLGRDDGVSLTTSLSDDDVCNLFTVVWPGQGSAMSFNETLGLPLANITSLNYRGARLYSLQWPFIRGLVGEPPVGAGPANEGAASIQAILTAPTLERASQVMACQLAQFMGDAERFQSGTIMSRLRLDVTHGEPFTLTLGGWTFSAYCEAVSHSIAVSKDGKQSGMTSITFSRGAYDDSVRSSGTGQVA